MKIGIDCRLWSETGVGRYIRNLVLNLQKIDNGNTYALFVLGKDNKEILKQVQNDNFETITADVKWHTIAEQIRFPQILNRENLDLMHFPYFSVPIFYNKPFVVTIHDLIVNHFSTGHASTLSEPVYNLKLLGYKFVLNQAAKKAKKIIAVSNATKKEIIDHLKINPQKIAVVHEGIDEKIRNPKSEIRNKVLNAKYFLYVGNAFPHKNLDRLLEAFSVFCRPELFSGSHNVKLILVGKEDYFYKRLKAKTQALKLSDRVTFLHGVSDEELSNLYKDALVLIVPSLMEGFGLPALEALANKCLVLSSDIPSSREVFGDAVIYFDPYSVKDIAEKLSEVFNSDIDKHNDKKEKGLKTAANFSWEKTAKETLKIYESCVSL
jgi:glycosyltransferase involved in cell wall biosynthesis